MPAKTCPVCQTEFWAQNSGQIRCSKRCEGLDRRAERNNLWTGGKITVPCRICNKPFEKWKSDQQTVCGAECRTALRRQPRPGRQRQADHVCKMCGKTFQAAPSSKRRYCSRACYAKYLKTIQGAEHPNYKTGTDRPDLRRSDWRRLRKQLFAAAGNQCTQCGSTTSRLVVHHIKPPDEAPELVYEPSNLQVICSHCHNHIHKPVEQRWRKNRATPQSNDD